MSEINRSEVSRALAKAIAFKNCGQDEKAEWWARQLIHHLQCASILTDEPAKDWDHPSYAKL